MEDNDLKKIIKDLDQTGDAQEAARVVQGHNFKPLEDVSQSFLSIKSRTEASRDLVVKILNDISQMEIKNSNETVLSGTPSKLRIQLHMGKFIGFGIPLALVTLVAIIVIGNPFIKEKSQVSELRTIGDEEKTVDVAGSSVQSYIEEEKQVSQIDSVLKDIQSVSLNPPITNDLFGAGAIALEAQNASFNPGLMEFIDQEKSVDIVNASFVKF